MASRRPARRHLPLAAVIGADSLSRLGSSLTFTAIPWFVLVTSGSVARTGVVVFVQALGVVLALLFGGTVVDRLSYRHASIAADLSAGAAVALIPLLARSVGLAFWQLLGLVFVAALLDTPAQVARYSALPDVARAAGVRFERANAVFDACLTLASLLGPALAGVLIVVVGASNVLWLDAASFGLSAGLVAAVPAGLLPALAVDRAEPYVARLRAALRFVRSDPVLFPLVIFFAAMNLAIGPIEAPIIPVYAHAVFGSAIALGLMSAVGAVGALAGNAVFGWLGHRLSRRAVFAAGFLTVPLALGMLAVRPPLWGALAVLGAMGLGLSLANLLEYTIYFERIPEGMRGRVLGVTGAIAWGTTPLGRLLVGLALAAAGLGPTLAGLALVFLPVPLVLLVLPAFRALAPPSAAAEIEPT